MDQAEDTAQMVLPCPPGQGRQTSAGEAAGELKATSGSSHHREQKPQAGVLCLVFIKQTCIEPSPNSRHVSKHYYRRGNCPREVKCPRSHR